MEDIYKYNNSISRFYDVIYEKILDKSGLTFYLEEISKADGPVLEIGAGTGRILVPALKNIADVYGIDQSEFMISELKKKISEKEYNRVSLQDAREFSWNKKFKLIIAPFRMFQHLLNTEDQIKALNRIYEHLEAGGKFIFDVFVPDLVKINIDRNDINDFDGEYEPGKKLQRFVSIKNNYIEQTLDVKFKFVWDENGEQRNNEDKFPFRYFFRYELENLIGRTKFKLENIFGDFQRNQLNNESKDFIIVCFKQ